MGYSYYCPHIAFGFRDVAARGNKFLSYDGGRYMRTFATEVNKGYVCDVFIGIKCRMDTKTGALTYEGKALEELMEFVQRYKAFHNISGEIELSYSPVLSGDCEYEHSYEIE
jgi:hypothetical protein